MSRSTPSTYSSFPGELDFDSDSTLDDTSEKMRRKHAQKGLPPPNMDIARHQCLQPGITTPDLVNMKDFVQFYFSTSKPRLDAYRLTISSINTIIECFFTSFICLIGTETIEKEQSEVYYIVRCTS